MSKTFKQLNAPKQEVFLVDKQSDCRSLYCAHVSDTSKWYLADDAIHILFSKFPHLPKGQEIRNPEILHIGIVTDKVRF